MRSSGDAPCRIDANPCESWGHPLQKGCEAQEIQWSRSWGIRTPCKISASPMESKRILRVYPFQMGRWGKCRLTYIINNSIPPEVLKLIKYDKILTKYVKNDKIHVEHFRDRNFLRKNKTLRERSTTTPRANHSKSIYIYISIYQGS